MFITRYAQIKAFITKDQSEIRELMHPNAHGNKTQSLAEAIVPPGTSTLMHRHLASEEIYYFVTGAGEMVLGEERFLVQAGDTVFIPPNTAHKLINHNRLPLKLLCCSAPAYSDEDTEILEQQD